jgi:hypothetical protein
VRRARQPAAGRTLGSRTCPCPGAGRRLEDGVGSAPGGTSCSGSARVCPGLLGSARGGAPGLEDRRARRLGAPALPSCPRAPSPRPALRRSPAGAQLVGVGPPPAPRRGRSVSAASGHAGAPGHGWCPGVAGRCEGLRAGEGSGGSTEAWGSQGNGAFRRWPGGWPHGSAVGAGSRPTCCVSVSRGPG